MRGHRLWGLPAFLMYITVHLFYLGGVGGRRLAVIVMMVGTWFGARENRVIEGELASIERSATADQPVAQG